MGQSIKNDNISRRELAKFERLIENYQPENVQLYSALNKLIYSDIDSKNKMMFDKTIDALFNSLDYPTEEWAITDSKMFDGYKLVKDCIIEYCTTDVKNITTVIDNVAFLHDKPIADVEKNMQLYMSSYGDTNKIMNAFMQYSDDFQTNVRKSNLPEGYIPVYSKAVALKIKEMQQTKQK